MKRLLLSAVIGALLLARPGVSGAEVAKGTLRLHLESSFITFYKGQFTVDDAPNLRLSGVSFGIGAPEREFSMGRQSVGIGGALIPNLILGGRVSLALVDRDDRYYWNDTTLFVMGVIPYLEYIFLDGTWRPFVTAQVGMEGWFGDVADNSFRLATFVSGAGGGLHVFLAPQFSIDATALFTFAVGGGRWHRNRANRDMSYWCLDLSVLLGLSGWI